MKYTDYSKAITAEDLIRRYNLDGLKSDRKKIYSNKESLDKTDAILNNFISVTTKNIEELQSQVDGNITTWFFNGVPNIENEPAKNWLTKEEKNNHLGDLYYDQETGYAYRWVLKDEEYMWIKIVDNDVAKALAIANSAQETADSKMQVFVAEPIPPYDVGDIWLKEDKVLYRCRAKRTEGTYNNADWILATDYTNDDYAKNVESILNQFKESVKSDYATKVMLETTASTIEASVTSVTNKTILLENSINNKVDIIEVEELTQEVKTIQTSTSQHTKAIEELKANDETQSKKIANFEISVNEINANLTNYTQLSKTISSVGQITLENAYEGVLNHLSIKGQMSLMFPSKTLYPNKDLFTKSSKISIDTNEYNLNINYLNYIDADVCDEYVNDNGKSKIIRRVGVNSDGSFYALGSEYIEYLDDVTLNIKSNSVIKMNCFDNVILKATYLLQNDITDTFTSKAEVKAELKITSDNINSEVSKKTDKDKIISTINQSAEQVKIDANKITLSANDILNLLAGNTINLGSKNITISSDNFNVDINGNAIMNNATMNNALMNSATMNNANIVGGNMTLTDGANIVSDKGLLTNLIYPAFTRGNMFNGSGDYLPLGHLGGGDNINTQRNALVFAFKLPANFTIKSAKVHLIHAPINWKHDNTSTTGYSRNLNLYRINSTNLEIDTIFYYAPYSSNYSLIPNALNFTGSPTGISVGESADITNEISTTSYNQLAVLTSDETIYNGNTEIFGRSGGVVGYLEVIGYTNFK